MEIKPEQLATQACGRDLSPVYLISGPETLRVLEAVDAVRARARAEGISEREVFDAGARDFEWSVLAGAFNAPSLFSARRLLEVRLSGGKPGKEGAEVISAFCAGPPADVVLMLIGDEWSRSHHGKWADAVSRCGVLSIAWAIKPHELPEWIERRLRRHGLSATQEAVRSLAERVEGNLLAAAQEIDKLALLVPEATLDVAEMEALVADSARYDVFRLIEIALSGHADQVSHMLAGLRAEGEAVAALMPAVIREILRAAALAQVQERGGNLGAEMKSQGLWEARQAPFRHALQRHPTALRWQRFIRFASRIDRAAKGRGDGDPWRMLERLLLAVAEPRTLRMLAA
ncbi:MAG: DNA polymerase III subunit delta [Xanthomonadaceae bacterium]|jgi:DNA polymerase-3 subunit delta|nr:DNA polymerase III subunit delta [Xanthomonadaceae bacterium]